MTAEIPLAFPRASRRLLALQLRRHAGTTFALTGLFGIWLAWLALGRVPIYAVSRQARLESSLFPVPVETPVDGVIAECNLGLGRRVVAGDVLLRIEARAYELQRARAMAELDAIETATVALAAQVEAYGKYRNTVADLARKTARAGHASVAVTSTNSKSKDRETEVIVHLHEEGLGSGLDSLRAKAEGESLRAQVDAAQADAERNARSSDATVVSLEAKMSELTKSVSDARSQAEVQRANIRMIEWEIERRDVRAPVAGVLGDVAPCTVGLTVSPSSRLATLLPDADVRVVSFFNPEDSIGRVQAGQLAILRIENFPWTQYGTVPAMVENVGTEARDGLVRVELRVLQGRSPIPILHGLTASTEIEVERTSPYRLLLRLAGRPFAVPVPVTVPGQAPQPQNALPIARRGG